MPDRSELLAYAAPGRDLLMPAAWAEALGFDARGAALVIVDAATLRAALGGVS